MACQKLPRTSELSDDAFLGKKRQKKIKGRRVDISLRVVKNFRHRKLLQKLDGRQVNL